MSRATEYFSGHSFQNNLGSICTITNMENGLFRGSFGTAVSENNGGEINGRELHGTYTEVEDGVLLNFNVQFGASQTVWCGKYYFGQEEFRMNWILNRNRPLGSEWESFLTGQDRFRRID